MKNITDRIEFERYQLDNGLKIVMSEDRTIPSVALSICYHVGSKDDEPRKKGLAHLFEHLMFEGSLHIPKGEYERITTYAGGENNAYTSEDKTNYYLLLPSNQLELGLWLESDRMLKCVVNSRSLETQKKVVIEERKQNFENRPYGTVSIEFAPRLFPDSGYGWDTIGDPDDICNVTLGDVREFFERFYAPNNAVLSLTGNFDKTEATDMIKRYFSGIRAGRPINRRLFSYRDSGNKIVDNINDSVQFPGIFFAYRIPQENSKEFFAFELLSEILSSGDSSRLYRELVYEKQLASEVGCWTDCKELAGVFNVYAILLPGSSIAKTEQAVTGIFERIRSEGIGECELQKAKNRIETKQVFRKQYILSKADMLGHYETFYSNPDLINTSINNYSVITEQDILGFSNQYLRPDNSVTLIYQPK